MPVVVLGAGRGRRMGGPKPLMCVEGRTWWEWQDESLKRHGLDAHWVVSSQVAIAMQRPGNAPACLVIGDASAPMFVSVLLGLANVRDLTRGAFVLPVDTPVPAIGVWRLLAGRDAPAHPTFGGKGGHPLFLPADWIETNLGAMIREAREAGAPPGAVALRLDELIEGTRCGLEVNDPAVIVNMNTPADVKAWITSEKQGESSQEQT